MTDWRDRAACLGIPVEHFVRYRETEDGVKDLPPSPRAKEACARCPVRDSCAEWASSEGLVGYFGGLTTRQREARFGPSPVSVNEQIESALATSRKRSARARSGRVSSGTS